MEDFRSNSYMWIPSSLSHASLHRKHHLQTWQDTSHHSKDDKCQQDLDHHHNPPPRGSKVRIRGPTRAQPNTNVLFELSPLSPRGCLAANLELAGQREQHINKGTDLNRGVQQTAKTKLLNIIKWDIIQKKCLPPLWLLDSIFVAARWNSHLENDECYPFWRLHRSYRPAASVVN